MYYKGNFINVIFDNSTNGIRGCVHKNRDDSYTIFVNANLCYEEQQSVILHELSHIENNDFDKMDIQKIEYYAHKN